MSHLNHEALVKTANELPPLPQAVIRLSELFADPDYEINDVVRAVELDSTLTGRLLRLANSSLYGPGRVGAIGEAVVRLGSGTVRSIAIASSVRPKRELDLSAFGLTPESYWTHCIAVLSFAEELAAQRVANFGNDLSTAALLHDFGKLVLSEHLTTEHVEGLQRMDPAMPSTDLEFRVLSVNHAEVSAVVAQAWNLPDHLVRAVQYHHSVEHYDEPICHGLNIANQLAWRMESREFELERESDNRQKSATALKLTDDKLDSVFAKGTERYKETLDVYS